MHQGRCSLFIIIVLSATIKSTSAITGCIVTLINPTSARRKVLCADPKGQLEYIPKSLPQTTDMLIISSQNITTVEENDFFTITEMTTLLLTFSNVKKVHKSAFKYLNHLIVLDLSGNSLTISAESLPVDIFSNLSELRVLKLTNNPLGFVPDLFFKPMSQNLRRVYLNKCNRPALKISPRAFKDAYNIEELDLRESGIVGFLQPMETDLREMKSLRTFLIGGNNFLCDCRLRWFYFYLSQMQDTITTVQEQDDKDVKCSGPEKLQDKRFPIKDERQQLRYIDFVCSPRCSVISARNFIVESGSSVNLTCECFTDPIQRLSWTKNGHSVEEMTNKYRFFQSGKETFQATLNILSLQPVDSGNWTCRIDVDSASQNFSLKVKSGDPFSRGTSVNVYIIVGLGSSLFLVSLVVVVVVMFCRRESLCHLQNQHPMVICGYETNVRKTSVADGDLQYRYNQQDGRFNTSFYENTIPFDSSLANYHQHLRSNHLFPDDLQSEKSILTKAVDLKTNFPKLPSDKMLNVYCGCNNYNNSEDDPDRRSSYSQRSRPQKSIQSDPTPPLNAEEKFQQLKLRASIDTAPAMKACPFHGSSGTLTRVPGHKPCPVHGSTATLPSRLSSRKVEHRFGCPKHNRDNISVKSLKLESPADEAVKPHRCKSVSKLPTSDKVMSTSTYRPCPLHGDILAAINENIFESSSLKGNSLKKKSQDEKIPSSIGCDRVARKTNDTVRSRGILTHSLTSPVQSSLSSSPLLTSDVHGTLV